MKKLFLLFFLFFSLLGFAQRDPQEKLAIQYYQNGEYEKAKEIFKPIYEKNNSSYIYVYYYQVLVEMQDYKELEKVAKNQHKKFPKVQRYIVDLAYVYEVSGNTAKAVKEYEDAIKNVPNIENSYKELYNAFLYKAKRDYAMETLLRGRKQLNNPKLFSKELTNLYLQLKLYDNVIEEAITLLADDDAKYMATAEQNLQNLLMDDEDGQRYLKIKSKLQETMQKHPNNQSYVSLLYWIYQLNKDYSAAFILAKSIDKKRANDGATVYALARLMANNREYDLAMEALKYVISKGESSSYYYSAKYDLLNLKYQKLISTYPIDLNAAKALEKEYQKVLDENGVHEGTSDVVHKYAHLLAFFVNKPDHAINLLDTAMRYADRDIKERALYKMDKADILLHVGEIWDATLLYSQIDKELPNDTIGHLAKFKNAKLSFYIGEFAWAESQLDILRAATTKLIANDAMYLSFVISDNLEEDEGEDEDDNALFSENQTHNQALRYFARADFLIFQNNDAEAMKYLDSVLIVTPFGKLNDDVYYLQAQILIRQKDYFTAETLLKKIIDVYSFDLLADDAIFLLAELYEYYMKDIPQAMEMYKKLLKDHSNSIYAVDARKRFRELRGDEI